MESYQKIQEKREAPQRRLVIPGELLGKGRAAHGTYEMNGNVYSRYIGLAEVKGDIHFVIPLSGAYMPKRGDGVIGRVFDIIFQKWIVDINCPYEAILPLSEGVEGYVDLTKADLTKFFDYNDVIFAEISSVTKQKQIQLTMRSRKCRKLRGGRLIKVTPTKVSRIIGRGGSMVEMIKQLTRTQIVVGQNGIVWVRGENEDLAVEAILTIEERAHVRGLTDYIKSMIEERLRAKGLDIPELSEKRYETSEREGLNQSDFENSETGSEERYNFGDNNETD